MFSTQNDKMPRIKVYKPEKVKKNIEKYGKVISEPFFF